VREASLYGNQPNFQFDQIQHQPVADSHRLQHPHPGKYEARVADNRPGIPERERERIFMKFVRGAIPRQSGAGLSLAISQQIVGRASWAALISW
jgi:hypothetical protein